METEQGTPETEPKRDKAAIIRHFLPKDYPPEWMEYVSGLNVYQRIHGAMGDIGPMKKDRMMDGGQQKFAYHGHAMITAQSKAVFEKWRIALSNTVLDESHEPIEIGKFKTPGYFTTARVRIRLFNIDDPTQFIEAEHIGYGQDTSDKGIGKAVTYASKYAIMKILMISDGEEPDVESMDWDAFDEEMGRKTKKDRKQAAKRGTTQQAAQEAAQAALQGKTDKPAAQMSNGELFAAIITELRCFGVDRDALGLYLKNHDGATHLNSVPHERMLALYSECRAKRTAYETCKRVAATAKDREGAEARLASVFDGRSAFAVTAEELYSAAKLIEGAAA